MIRVALPEDRIRPLRRSEYERLVEAGVFDNERVELLFGRLVSKSPEDEPHSFTIQQLNALFTPRLAGRAIVRVQSPIVAPDESRPEPDVAVVPLADYRRTSPREAHLIIEVAQSSLDIDRDAKATLYALMGVPEYWIVNLEEWVVEVHTDPPMQKDGKYVHVERKGGAAPSALVHDAHLAPRAFPDVGVTAREFLPL